MQQISGTTRLVGIIGWPVEHSLSPRMHNAAFEALGLDWAYVALPTPPERLEEAVRGLAALGFAGANVTTPHKLAVRSFCETDAPSVNTLVIRDGRVEGSTTDAAVLRGLTAEAPVVIGDGGTAAAFVQALPGARQFSRRGVWPPEVAEARSRGERDLGARCGRRRGRRGPDARRPPVSGDGDGRGRAGSRCTRRHRARGPARPGSRRVRAVDRSRGAGRRHEGRPRLRRRDTRADNGGRVARPRARRDPHRPAGRAPTRSGRHRPRSRAQASGLRPQSAAVVRGRRGRRPRRACATARRSGRRSRSSSATATTRTGSGG